MIDRGFQRWKRAAVHVAAPRQPFAQGERAEAVLIEFPQVQRTMSQIVIGQADVVEAAVGEGPAGRANGATRSTYEEVKAAPRLRRQGTFVAGNTSVECPTPWT